MEKEKDCQGIDINNFVLYFSVDNKGSYIKDYIRSTSETPNFRQKAFFFHLKVFCKSWVRMLGAKANVSALQLREKLLGKAFILHLKIKVESRCISTNSSAAHKYIQPKPVPYLHYFINILC